MTNTTKNNAIRTNQNGYSLHLPKYIAVLVEAPVYVYNEDGTLIKEFDAPELSFDEASGDNVALINLGDIPCGTYSVSCAGCRVTVTVKEKAYSALTDGLIKALYFQRCGCELTKAHAGLFTHKPCHTAPAFDWDDKSKSKVVTGGWHDAGDYGKYVSPGAVTVAHMLYAYMLFPNGCDRPLNIPETGNAVPDILNEARWELEWILKMQREDGAFYHKLTKDHFAPFIMPEDDTDPEYLVPPSHCATADATAVLALAARIYDKFDPGFSKRMLDSALKGWQWLKANQNFIPYVNPEGLRTGPYSDTRVIDELFWASCELFATTGETIFGDEAARLYRYAKNESPEAYTLNGEPGLFEEMLENERVGVKEYVKKFPYLNATPLEGLTLTEFGWADVSGLGTLCCLFSIKEKGGNNLYGDLKRDFLLKSPKALERSENSCYGTALRADEYIWGSILNVMNNAMTMIVDYMLTGNEDMRNAALCQLDYALGLNALDISFVTGFGIRSVQNPHHRPSGADTVKAPVPGFIVGGPNKRWTYPQTRERLGEATPAAKYYIDEEPFADMNEVAIYWNSPTVFVSAFFDTF